MTTLERFAARLARDEFVAGDADKELVALHALDAVAAMIAAAATSEGRALLAFRDRAAGGAGRDLGTDLLVRCALARASEIDDIHLASMTTAGAIVVPAALSLAAVGSARPVDLHAAIIAGYETMIRFGEAIDGPSVLYRGIWPTYLAAPIGVAAVAARLMRFDETQTTHALALALTLAAPGVGHHNAVTTSRWFAVGHAARTGFRAAEAVSAGFTADVALLDGGFMSGVHGLAVRADALAADRRTLPEVSFKPWCAARQTMAATQGLMEAARAGLDPAAIMAIEVGVPPPQHRMVAHGVVAGDRASHLTSLPYHMASAVLAPAAQCDIGQNPAAVAPEVRTLMDRITVVPDDAVFTDYPRVWPARLSITTAAGTARRVVAHVPGDPARPFSASDLDAKIARLARLADDRRTNLRNRISAVLTGAAPAAVLVAAVEEDHLRLP